MQHSRASLNQLARRNDHVRRSAVLTGGCCSDADGRTQRWTPAACGQFYCSSFQPVLSFQHPPPHPLRLGGKFLRFHNVTRRAVQLNAHTPTPTLVRDTLTLPSAHGHAGERWGPCCCCCCCCRQRSIDTVLCCAVFTAVLLDWSALHIAAHDVDKLC